MITLSDGTTTVNLNPDLYWSDENWLPVEQSVERTLTGALIVSVSALTGGRPITLQPEDDSSGWTRLVDLTVLRNFAAIPGKQLSLTIRGVTRSVIFRHKDGAIEATPVLHFSDVDGSDFYRATLRFLEV